MADDVTIRSAAPADLEAWVRLRHELWPDANPDDLRRDGEGHFRHPGSLPTLAEALLLMVDGAASGFVDLSLRNYAEGCESSPVAYVEGWYVVEGLRRRGYGILLLEAAQTWARGRGCTEIASDARADNAVSRLAHRAAGFEVVEEIVCFRKAL